MLGTRKKVTPTNTNVTLKMKEEHVVAVPRKLPKRKVGDTVTFNSDYDAFKVIFKGRWPFKGKEHIVRNNKLLTFDKTVSFKFLCYIGTRPASMISPQIGHKIRRGRITWASYKGAGGTGSVKPPGR